MWNLVVEYITDWLRVICTILAFVIPYGVYKINQRLHDYGDPAWKKQENQKQENSSNLGKQE